MTPDQDGATAPARGSHGDQTLSLLRRGYPWAAGLRSGAVAVRARVLGRPAVVVGGVEGVRRFYDGRLRRRGAFPPPIKLVLFGRGAVHGLDGEAHHARKALLLDVVGPEAVAALGRRADEVWRDRLAGWSRGTPVVLFDEAVQVLAASVLPWAGIPAGPGETRVRALQLAAVVDGFATAGTPYLRACRARAALNRWAAGLVRRTRDGDLQPPPGYALRQLAEWRSPAGRPLSGATAGVELLNVVRPTVAVAWFVAYAGLALAGHPDWRVRVSAGDERAVEAFAQEVRRCYPFVPVLAARARHAQDVLGQPVRRGGLVVLDVHGTTHDADLWTDPDGFRPERFWAPVAEEALVPQGGGDVRTGHRCPGEGVTLTMLAVAVRRLAAASWTLPEQDVSWSTSRMPTRPRSGVRLRPA